MTSLQLESLEAELARLDALLAPEEAWAALCQLEARCVAGETAQAFDEGALRRDLEASLRGNPIYLARTRIAEAIGILRSNAAGAARNPDLPPRAVAMPPRTARVSLSDRMEVIEPLARGDVFRTRVNIKQLQTAAEPVPQSAASAVSGAGAVGAVGDDAQSEAPQARAFANDPEPGAEPAAALAAPDDLTAIRGIDAGTAAALAGRGIADFRSVAAWSAANVASVRTALGLGRRISREVWIEQAAILAMGRETEFSARGRGFDMAAPSDGAGALTAAAINSAPHMGDPSPEDAGGRRLRPAPRDEPAPRDHAAPAEAPADDPQGTMPTPAQDETDVRATAPETVAADAGVRAPQDGGARASDRTRALFERTRWVENERSLQAAVLAAEAAVTRRMQSGVPSPARVAPVPIGAAAGDLMGRDNPAAAGGGPTPDPGAVAAAPPPPPGRISDPDETRFGRALRVDDELESIVGEIRREAARKPGPEVLRGERPEAAGMTEHGDDDDATAPGGPDVEEATVEIVRRQPSVEKSRGRPEPAAPIAIGSSRPLPEVETPQSEEIDGIYRGMATEASVEIVYRDGAGRRIVKARR